MAIAASLRRQMLAGLCCALIALAAASVARGDGATPATLVDNGAPAAQNASVPPPTSGEDSAPAADISREYLIKAAILFNFAKFAAWPENAFRDLGTPLNICVLGQDPFGAALETLNGKQVRNRPLTTTRLSSIDDAPQCHIMFVSASEESRLPKILEYVGKLPILTVADMDRFATAGGVIALKEVDNRSRIEINVGAAEQAGLRLSSKLLRLADTVSTQAAESQQ